MIKLREAILVEGRYDVNTVRQVVDTVVLETGGFRIFNNKDQLKVIRRIAETQRPDRADRQRRRRLRHP